MRDSGEGRRGLFDSLLVYARSSKVYNNAPTTEYLKNPTSTESTRDTAAAYWPRKGLIVNVRLGAIRG